MAGAALIQTFGDRLTRVDASRALAAAMPSIWRSRRRLVSNSAKRPSMSRKALPAARWPSRPLPWPLAP